MELSEEQLAALTHLVMITYPKYTPDQVACTFKYLCREVSRYKECKIETQTLYYMGYPIHSLSVREI
jgi:hypothetical protein